MIEIHLDGKPVTKLQAALALAARNGMSVDIGIPAGEACVIGVPDICLFSTVRGEFRQSASWPSGGAESGAGMWFYAGMFALAAEVAELAEMIAAEQEPAAVPCEDYDPDYKLHGCELGAHAADKPHRNLLGEEWRESLQVPCPSVSNEGTPCVGHFGHYPALHQAAEGVEQWRDAIYDASGPRKPEQASLVGRIVIHACDDSPLPVIGKVVGQVDEATVEVLWGARQHEENPGTGTYEPIDALRPWHG